jgi:hypothetical protein
MRLTARFSLLLLVVACLAASPAGAGIPSASTSTVPARLFLCPAGDSVFVVLPRHLSMNPWAEGDVWVNLCACPAVVLARVDTRGYTVDAAGCVVTAGPLPDATYRFPLAGGGACPGGWALTYAEGVLLARQTTVVSPDQNGDLRVDSTDVAIVSSKLGTPDPGADLDGDGLVTEADVALVAAHLGHASPAGQTPALPITWGGLKLHYR